MLDSIDAELLDYYQRELTWLRSAGSAFAETFPKEASRLELGADECTDPHVERLLEGFALLTARLQRRLDDDYAEFSDALLEQLYPLVLRPLPSCAIAQFTPDTSKGKLNAGYCIPKGSPLFADLAGSSVRFRTTAEVNLWPLEITSIDLLEADKAVRLSGQTQAQSALRISIRCLQGCSWDELSLESLRLHLTASPTLNAKLYDLFAAHCIGTLCAVPERTPKEQSGSISLVGFNDDEALLPQENGLHPGLRLLTEYFAFAEKFAFFDVPIQAPQGESDTRELFLLFNHAISDRTRLHASDISLGCAPVINLFSHISEPLRPDGTSSEYRLVADSHRENSVEIHSILSMSAAGPSGMLDIAPYHGHQHHLTNPQLYWQARRIAGMTPNRLGTDLMLTLVDTRQHAHLEAPDYTLTGRLLCTNRHQAELLAAGTRLNFERPGPISEIHLRNRPTPQSLPNLSGESRWRLISQLTLNHLSLVEGPEAINHLREMLSLHNLREESSAHRQIAGLLGLQCQRVTAHVGEDAWRGWRNGLQVRLNLDPGHFVGSSTVLFSAVLAQFFSLYANANRFVSTVLMQGDKEVKAWQPQAGMPITL